MSFEHLMEKDEAETPQDEEKKNSDLITLKADIEALKLRINEDLGAETCRLDENSETITGMRTIEKTVQEILEQYLSEIKKKPTDPNNKSLVDVCNGLIAFLDKYRYIKVQLELLKSVNFPTKPLNP